MTRRHPNSRQTLLRSPAFTSTPPIPPNPPYPDPLIPFRLENLEEQPLPGWYMRVNNHYSRVDDRLIEKIRRDPSFILGWFDPDILNIWMSLSQSLSIPPHLRNQQTVTVTFLSTPYTHLSDQPPQTIQLNQIITPSLSLLPNLQPVYTHIISETLLPIPPLPLLDSHCLVNHPRDFILKGQLYMAEKLVVEPNLSKLRVIVRSCTMQEYWGLDHHVKVIPFLKETPQTTLGPEWIDENNEALNQTEVNLPPLPLFNTPMKVLLWNCRGAANPHFRRHFNNLMEDHRPQLVVLTETRVGGSRGTTLCQNLGFSKYHIVETHGFAGGIWLFWNDLEIHCDIIAQT
ncbi:hypothetical protein LOK49_LG07G00813 [Camellia lanceoleosa]|uniref:Uncharacterized protein n=1 Tax=Camellia lanceoleosa TaxID=1840588 RepID=A0ACC0GXW9_9ERIC|nr:hypothetical protein LOK49_LG07G00813 [Camellia lanceoleosa]